MSLDVGTRILGRGVEIGDRSNIARGGEIFGPCRIGADVYINRDVYLRAGTTIGDRVAVGPFCRFITDGHEVGGSGRRAGTNRSGRIAIGDGAWIGAGVTVLGSVTVGRGAVVAAGSVVTRNVPADTLVAGVPARVMRQL